MVSYTAQMPSLCFSHESPQVSAIFFSDSVTDYQYVPTTKTFRCIGSRSENKSDVYMRCGYGDWYDSSSCS